MRVLAQQALFHLMAWPRAAQIRWLGRNLDWCFQTTVCFKPLSSVPFWALTSLLGTGSSWWDIIHWELDRECLDSFFSISVILLKALSSASQQRAVSISRGQFFPWDFSVLPGRTALLPVRYDCTDTLSTRGSTLLDSFSSPWVSKTPLSIPCSLTSLLPRGLSRTKERSPSSFHLLILVHLVNNYTNSSND